MSDHGSELWVADLGLIEYDEALALQHAIHEARSEDLIPDVLLLLEHPPVYTRGRRSSDDELPMGEQWYLERGIEVRDVSRGGKVTFHCPGQLVGYPIVSTEIFSRDIGELVCAIERALIRALKAEGVEARSDTAGRGVWAGDAKIASIGLHISRNVTTHGFMVNVENDLEPFAWIKPCGLDVAATSIAEATGRRELLDDFKDHVCRELAAGFALRPRFVSREQIEARAGRELRQMVGAK